MTYSEKLKDPRWQRKRLEVMQRDNFTCLDCESSANTLHVHHCLYVQGREPWEYPNEELRTLCWSCHEERAALEHDAKLEFARLLALLPASEIIHLVGNILKCKSDTENGVVILSRNELDWREDCRWFSEAYREPSMRPIYEAVTGSKPRWP